MQLFKKKIKAKNPVNIEKGIVVFYAKHFLKKKKKERKKEKCYRCNS